MRRPAGGYTPPVSTKRWEQIYEAGEQLNAYPFDGVVSFAFHHRSRDGSAPRALDVGCGSGVHARLLARLGFDVLGFDPSDSAVAHARAEAERHGLTARFETAAIEDVDLGGAPFSMVVDRCSSTHTTPDAIRAFYKRLAAAMAPGGRIHAEFFSEAHDDRALGSLGEDGAWHAFSGGIFAPLGRTCFFDSAGIDAIFEDLTIARKTHVSERDEIACHTRARWVVEAYKA